MSHTAIDQLFQVTAPTRSGRESARSGPANGDLFRSHLDRAAEVAEPKPTVAKKEDRIAPVEKDESLEPQTDEQDTSTAEHETTIATAEKSKPTTETDEEPQPAEETSDEVTLSAAAAATQQGETVVAAEQVVSVEGVVEISLADGQHQSDEHSASELAEATNGSGESAAGNEAIELEAALLGESEAGETASDDGEVSVETEVVANATKTVLRPESSQAAATTAVEGEAKKLQSSTSAAINAQQALAKQLSADDASGSLPPIEADEGSAKTTGGRFDVPTTTTTASSELAVTTDAELALANLNNSSESTANSPNASTPSSADTVAAAGRTLGNLLAGKTGTAGNTTNTETPTTETPTVDRAKFVQRVGGAIRSAQNRDGQIQLRLSPPELGTLRINIVLNEGVLTAHLETETTAARAVLLDNLPALRERLAEQEIRIDKFDVNVGQEGQQQADNPETDDRQANRSRSQTNKPSSRKNPSQTTEESNPSQPVTASGLDVRI